MSNAGNSSAWMTVTFKLLLLKSYSSWKNWPGRSAIGALAMRKSEPREWREWAGAREMGRKKRKIDDSKKISGNYSHKMIRCCTFLHKPTTHNVHKHNDNAFYSESKLMFGKQIKIIRFCWFSTETKNVNTSNQQIKRKRSIDTVQFGYGFFRVLTCQVLSKLRMFGEICVFFSW